MVAARPHAYVPSLDGLRAVSVLLVCASHVGLGRVVPGGFGVTVFFFISGYLITGQLAAEHRARGRIDFRRFYMRRVLRLMPAALGYLAIAGGAFLLLGGRISPAGWLAAVFYGGNYYDLYATYGNAGTDVRHPFNIIWSLAVEEHFYLLLPPLLALLLGRGSAARQLLAGACLAEFAWRWVLFRHCLGGHPGGLCGLDPADRIYKATDARLDSLAYGALLALAGGWVPRSRTVIIAALLLLVFGSAPLGAWPRQVLRYSAQGAALFVLVPALIGTESALRRLLESAPAVVIGRMSYSIYLWHWGALMVADAAAPGGGIGWAALAAGLTAGLAVLSYSMAERRMLRLRRRFGSQAPQHLPLPARGPVHATPRLPV